MLNRRWNRISGLILDFFLYAALVVFSLMMILPFAYVLGNSLLTNAEYLEPGLKFFPTKGISFDSYKTIFSTDTIYRAYGNTLYLVFFGTTLSIFMTSVAGFALSRKQMVGARGLTFFYVFTMLVQGGTIPSYILIRSLGLMNSLWAMILPVTINTFFLIILKNFFSSIPESLEESAYIDGANELYILFRIFIPLSTPALATITLFYAVGYWNSFFLGVLYLTDKNKWPLQLVLRDILLYADTSDVGGSSYAESMGVTIKMATVIVAVIPIMCIYPFLQKYFSKGVLLGAVKE